MRIQSFTATLLTSSLFVSAGAFAQDHQDDGHHQAHDQHHGDSHHASGEHHGPEPQDFLFLVSEAYHRSQGEFQTSFSFENDDFDADGWQSVFRTEYGITDNIEFTAELPWKDTGHDTGFGDMKFALAVGLTHESDDTPAIALAFEAIAPTGDATHDLGHDVWGFGLGLHASKHLGENVVFHAAIGQEELDNALVHGHHYDITETYAGAGFVAEFSDGFSGSFEYLWESEEESDSHGVHTARQGRIALGAIFETDSGIEFGVSTLIGVSDHAPDNGLRVKIQRSW